MAQKSGQLHLCNVKCRKFCDGEQDVLVFLKVLWYANKCIVTCFRIHPSVGQTMVFVAIVIGVGVGVAQGWLASYTLVITTLSG